MSWLERINNTELLIITGDGKEYRPLWIESKRNLKYNTASFDFVGVKGTYVERKEQSGNEHPILLHFQGDDCIDQVNAFEISAADKRPWTFIHPFLDEQIYVQPSSLEIDTTNYNVATVSGTVYETILTKYPEDKVVPNKQISYLKADNEVLIADTFENKIDTPSAADITTAGGTVTTIEGGYNLLVKENSDAAKLKDLARAASGAAQSIIQTPISYIQQTIALINFPFQLQENITTKIQKLLSSIDDLGTLLFGADEIAESNKVMYESLVASVLSTACENSLYPIIDVDYTTRAEVLKVINDINTYYEQYKQALEDQDYNQDSALALGLDNIINLTLSNLFDVAFNAKQERTIYIEKEDNIINLAHKYFGAGDANLERFMKFNDITLNEYLGLKKCREIRYLV